MHSLFEPTAAQRITDRIEQLTPSTPGQWGKMNVAQMMAHCSIALELFLEGKTLKRPLMGLIFGGIAKKRMLANKPWAKNLPTANELKPSTQVDFDKEKARLLQRIKQFVDTGANVPSIPHPFFGKMSTSDWGFHQHKHLDHHLTQFGV